MHYLRVALTTALAILICAAAVSSGETEQDIINRYFKKAEKMHKTKVGWLSGNFMLTRVNKNNDYNSFATGVSSQLSNGSIPWIGQQTAFGLEFGMLMKEKWSWGIGGEYWMKFGPNETGNFIYSPPGGASQSISNLRSEVQIYGITTSLQYFVKNAPSDPSETKGLSLRLGGTLGYYFASWDLWPEYQNLNLATSSMAGTNTTFKGTAPGIWLSVGADQHMGFYGLQLGADFGYQYLNFANMAWYNSLDQEVVVTYSGLADGRVDLDLSGFRGKLALKRYFSW